MHNYQSGGYQRSLRQAYRAGRQETNKLKSGNNDDDDVEL